MSNGPEIERDRAATDGKVAVTLRRDDADEHVPRRRSSSARSRPPSRSTSTARPLRIVHVPGKGHLTDFGLEVGAAALRWFQDYYGIPYPSEKCDMLALPDFAAGAMENLGCITYRETLLLVDPATAPRPSSSWSPTSSPTSWPTCGSATSSRCGGGTASG